MPSPTNNAADAAQAGMDAAKEVVVNPLQAAHRTFSWLEQHQAALIDAAVILAVGFVAAVWIGRISARAMSRRNLDAPIRDLLVRLMRVVILGLAITMALDNLGFNLTALIAGAGVIGVGVGFGMQSMISNMVAGLTLIFTKPFRLGEYVEILSVRGIVTHINLMSTTLLRADLSRVIIPNQKIIGDVLHNFGNSRQIELIVAVAYQTDLKNAMAVALELANANPRVLRQPAAGVSIGSLSDFAVLIKVNAWVKLEDFGPAQSEIYQAIVERYRQQQIQIPYPQREIRVLSSSVPQPEAAWK